MFSLIISTITTSAVDSINPIVITEQFVLQSLVKKRWHIWFFMIAVCLTNIAVGIAVYYGLGALISSFYDDFISKFDVLLYALELALGIGLIAFTMRMLAKRKTSNLYNTESEQPQSGEQVKVRSVSPLSLIVIGIVSTLSEITTALPYFAFLTILLGYSVAVWQVLLLLVLYNIIYIFPQIVMYIVYVKKQDLFDRFYTFIKTKMTRWAKVLTPLLTSAVGLVLVIYSTFKLVV